MGSDCFTSKSSKPQTYDISSNIRESNQYLNGTNKEKAQRQKIKRSQSYKNQDIKLNVLNNQTQLIAKSDIEIKLLQNQKSKQKQEQMDKKQQLKQIYSTKQTKNSPKTDIQLYHIEQSQLSEILKQGQIKKQSLNLGQTGSNSLNDRYKNKSGQDKQRICKNVKQDDEQQSKEEEQNRNQEEDDDDDIFKAAGVGYQDGSKVIKWSGIKKLSSSETKNLKSRKEDKNNFLRNTQLQVKDQDFSQQQGNIALMEQDQLEGAIIQQQNFSTIKVYNSKIMFEAVLPKSQAGPIIVPFLDYFEYCL